MKRMSGLKLAVTTVLVAGALSPLNALAANKFIVKDSSGATDQFVVTDAGSAGIGLGTGNSPATAVHVKGTSVSGDNNPPSSQIRLHDVGNAGITGGSGFMGLHSQPGGAMPLASDRLGYFLFGTVSNFDQKPIGGAGLASRALVGNWRDKNDPLGLSVPAGISFETADVAGGRTPRIVVAPNGNVAIGGGYASLTTLDWYLAKQKLEVIGGVKINNLSPDANQPNPVKPACNSTDGPTTRGTFWFTNGGASADKIEICVFDGANYLWKTVALQ